MFSIKSSLLVFSVVAVASTASAFDWKTGSGGRVQYADNCDYFGDDIYHQKISNTKCGDVCADGPKCTHWSYEPTNGCWFKNGWTATPLEKPGVACGFVNGRFATVG